MTEPHEPDRDAGPGMKDATPRACATCRHHSKSTRAVVLGLEHSDQVGLDFEDVAVDDERIENVYYCMKQGGAEQGVGEEAGTGCSIWGKPEPRGLNPQIAALLTRRGL